MTSKYVSSCLCLLLPVVLWPVVIVSASQCRKALLLMLLSCARNVWRRGYELLLPPSDAGRKVNAVAAD